jgi:hypothetical protein
VPQFAEDPRWSVGSLVLSMSVVVASNVRSPIYACFVGSPYMWRRIRRSLLLLGVTNVEETYQKVASFVGGHQCGGDPRRDLLLVEYLIM